MTRAHVEDLMEISETIFRFHQAKVREIQIEEDELRRKIADIDVVKDRNVTLPHEDLVDARAIGADLHWQRWVTHARQNLQNSLARVLVRKAEQTDVLRRAFGKSMASTEVFNQLQSKYSGRKAKREQYQIETLMLLQKLQTDP